MYIAGYYFAVGQPGETGTVKTHHAEEMRI